MKLLFVWGTACLAVLCLSGPVLSQGAQMPAEGLVYDFVAHAPQAFWTSGAGQLGFPGRRGDNRGFAVFRDDSALEDGATGGRVLETHPQWVNNGWIRGTYPTMTVPENARLRIVVGFLAGASGTDGVDFLVDFVEGAPGQRTQSLVSHRAAYDGSLDTIEKDLALLAGKQGRFVLTVKAGESSGQDWAAWVEAAIVTGVAEQRVEATLSAKPASYSGPCPTTVEFTGVISVTQPGTVQYEFVRSDGTRTAEQTLAFKGPGSQQVTATWVVESDYSGWMVIKVTSPQEVESNRAQFSVECSALPDLVVDKVECTSEGFLVVTLRNTGAGSLPKGASPVAAVYLNGASKGSIDLRKHTSAVQGGIAEAGGSSTYATRWSVTGSVTVRVVVDPSDRIEEADETNNEWTGRPPCLEPLPDLSVREVEIDPAGPSAGDTVAIDAVIHNAGAAAARDVAVLFQVDQLEVARTTVSLLKAGAEAVATVTWPASAGDHVIGVTVDPEGAISESDEKNNQATSEIAVELATVPLGAPPLFYQHLPYKLLMAGFTLFVDEYSDRGEWDDEAGQAVGLEGTAWLSFDCPERPAISDLVPLVPEEYTIVPHAFRVVGSVTDPDEEISLEEARLVRPGVSLGETVELYLPVASAETPAISEAKENLIRAVEGTGRTWRKGDVRVRFAGVTIVPVPEAEGVGRVIEGYGYYPTEPAYPEVIRLTVDGFTAIINLLRLTPEAALAHVTLELPPTIAQEGTCAAASLDLGETEVTPDCEFYVESRRGPFGPWILGETGLVAQGTGYTCDFSSSESPASRPPSWKGVLLQEGSASGESLIPVQSNTGYLAGRYAFRNATVTGPGFAGRLDLFGSHRFSPILPAGYAIEVIAGSLDLAESRILSGRLGPGNVELPTTAVVKDGMPGSLVTGRFTSIAVEDDLDLGGEIDFGDMRIGWGELSHAGTEVVPWMVQVGKAYLYLPAAPTPTFSPDEGTEFLDFELAGSTVEDVLARLEGVAMAGVSVRGLDMEGLVIRSRDELRAPGMAVLVIPRLQPRSWLHIGSRGVDGEIRAEIETDVQFGNPDRPDRGYVGGRPFNAHFRSVTEKRPLLIQFAASAVYESEMNGSLDVPAPCNIVGLEFNDMELTSTADLVGGAIELPSDGVTLEYWHLGFVPTGERTQAGVVSARTGRLVFTAAGISEPLHFETPFALTWCEMLASGNLGELFLDYNSWGQRFDKLPFSPHHLSLSPYRGGDGLAAGAYLAVCGDVHLSFFGSAYANIRDARSVVEDDPHYGREVTVPKSAEPGSSCGPTDLHLVGECDDTEGEDLVRLDFPDAEMDYDEVAQWGFVGTGSAVLSYLQSDGLTARIDIRADRETGAQAIDVRLSSDTAHDLNLGLYLRLASLGRVAGCIRIEGPLLKRIAINAAMEVSTTSGFLLTAKSGYSVDVILSVTPDRFTFYAGGSMFLAVANAAVEVVGSVFLEYDYTRGSAEGLVMGRVNCRAVVALEAEGQLTWYVDSDAQYVQGMVAVGASGRFGGLGLEGGFFLGHNAPKPRAWVLYSASEHFGIEERLLRWETLTGVYGYGQVSSSIDFFILSGGFTVYAGLGGFFSPETVLSLAGSAGVYVHGEILGGLVSVSGWGELDAVLPEFYFAGRFGLSGCVLWVICASIEVGAGYGPDGFFVSW